VGDAQSVMVKCGTPNDLDMTIKVPAWAFTNQLRWFRQRMARPGKPFRDFTTGVVYDEEFYKTRVRDEALRRLELPTWDKAAVGSGKLIKRIINAIEVENPKGAPKGWRHNNLVQWEAKYGAAQRPHQALYVAQSDSAKKLACESALFDFFADKIEPSEAMAKFISVFGKRYDVISFLFFLKDWEQFMQVRSAHFQKAFSMLGVSWNGEAPKLFARCSWDNYTAFNTTLSIVKDYLLDEGIPNVRLIDAHSFCWVLSYQTPGASVTRRPVIPEIQLVSASSPPGGVRRRAVVGSAVTVDWEELQRRRGIAGRLAEEIAFAAEQNRVRREAGDALAERVRLVSDDAALGYDIESFEADASPRWIEVKKVQQVGNTVSWFVSANQWEVAQERKNYWFYLVTDPGKPTCTIQGLPAEELKRDWLTPATYQARISVH
jgi:Domain of unknown function (DUF3883)